MKKNNKTSVYSNINKNESLQPLLKEINKYHKLSQEEEYQLAIEAKAGNQKAREKFIMSNMRMVLDKAADYASEAYPIDLLMGHAEDGLIEAFDKYDPERGRFFAFAQYHIWEKVQDCTENKLTGGHRDCIIRSQLNMIRERLAQQEGRDISDNELCYYASDELGKEPSYLLDILSSTYVERFEGDAPSGYYDEDDMPLTCADTKSSDDDIEMILIAKEWHDLFLRVLSQLPKRTAQVINLRYGLEDEEGRRMMVKDIAELLDITPECVRLHHNSGIKFLREHLREYYLAA